MSESPDRVRSTWGELMEWDGTRWARVDSTRPVPAKPSAAALVSLGCLEEPAPYVGPWGGRLVEGYPTILYGEGGQGKSLLALTLATCVAAGLPFGGVPMPQGRALYLDFELGVDEQRRRAGRIARGAGLESPPDDLLYLSCELPLLDFYAELKEILALHDVRFLVIDSLGPGAGVRPEDAEDIIPVMRAIKNLNVMSLIVDHQSKRQEGQSYNSKTPFGSVYKFNLARSVLQLERRESTDHESQLVLSQVKHNFGSLNADLGLQARFTRDAVSFTSSTPAAPEDLPQRLWDALEYAMTIRELCQRLGRSDTRVQAALASLRAQGRVQEDGRRGKALVWRRVLSDAQETFEEVPF